MIEPKVLAPRPARTLSVLGGLAGTLLLSALLYLAPALGLPFVDVPRLLGGIFTASPDAAFWIGYGFFFLSGVLVFPALLSVAWPGLPGRGGGFGAALVKGAAWGLVLWGASGVILPLAGAVNRIDALENPGFFGLGMGGLTAVGLLLGHLAYGLAVALIATMSHGIRPIDTLGWTGYRHGSTGEILLRKQGRDA